MSVSLGRRKYSIFAVALVCLAVLWGCETFGRYSETLKKSAPIKPLKEYEIMILGRYDADYVGTENCLKACHFHDKIKLDFEASTMGAQMSPKTGLPLVDCESCHGPGSLAVKDVTPEKIEEDKKAGKQTACNYKTLINLMELPPQARSLICIKCHTANATFNLHNWNSGIHAVSDVSCSDCHKIHAGPDLIVKPQETYEMCYQCHEEVRGEFALPSHHPVMEKKVICSDCHDPHGSVSEKLLRHDTFKATCTACHAEKEGPFAFEHADLTEECAACHSPHGSVNNYLLSESLPFLCLQCHEGHGTGALNVRCTDCHSSIHGTDVPSVGDDGRGTGRFIH